MIYLSNIQKQFGSKILFSEINYHLRPKEKVGLVGDNGMGKTTLFRIILGLESSDSGSVNIRKGARVAMIAQNFETRNETVLEHVVLGDTHFSQIKESMQRLEEDQGFHEREPEKWSQQYGETHNEFERMGGYGREAKAKTILNGLGFRNGQWNEPISQFSGGWRMRAELSRLLLQNPDVLLLDEPSNHLDLRSVIWLEQFLKNYDGALMLISHDRKFLNSIVNRIVHIDQGKLTIYTGNYDEFERQKDERETQLDQAAANQQRRIGEIERFIERFRAKNTKATQVQSRIKMLDKMERIQTESQTRTIDFRFPQPARSGRISIDFRNVKQSYGPKVIYENLELSLERGSKIALVGANGAGKSTLLKLLAGTLQPTCGKIKLGANVTRAYYAQHQSETLNSEHTILESLGEVAGSMGRTQQQKILGVFCFSGEDVKKKISVLSGGERSRLALGRMLVAPASIILLDEPTNHLDMRSCNVLAAALADFEGTLVVISHDRYFLDGFINRVWEVEQGQIKEYLGNYGDYESAKAKEEQNASTNMLSAVSEKKDKSQKRLDAEKRNLKHRLRKPLEEKLSGLEKRLEKVMTEKDDLDKVLGDKDIYQESRKDKLLKTLSHRKELEQEEDTLFKEIEQLTDQLEGI